MPERTPRAGKTWSASCTLRGLSCGDRGRCASCSSRRAGTSSSRPASSWAWARSRSPPPRARGQRLLQDALLCAHGPAGQLRRHGGVALARAAKLRRSDAAGNAVYGVGQLMEDPQVKAIDAITTVEQR